MSDIKLLDSLNAIRGLQKSGIELLDSLDPIRALQKSTSLSGMGVTGSERGGD